MHIVQLANFYGPRSGGLRTAIDELGRRYLETGHRVSLIVPGDVHRVDRTDGRTVISIAGPLVPGLGGYRAIIDRTAVTGHLERLRPDVVELSDKTTLVAPVQRCRDVGVPVVLISHERVDALVGRALPLRGWSRRVAHRFNRRLLHRVDAIVCASRFTASEFDGLAGVTGPAIRRIALGVDLDAFVPATTGRGRPPRIVSAVRLSPEKSPDIIVEAARAMSSLGVEYVWDVHGDGPERARLESSAAGLPVRFLGFTRDRSTLARAMAEADVGVAPGQFETFGLAALEFFAAGTPVVAPDRGALREIVVDGAGHVRPPTGDAFAAAIVELTSGDRQRQRVIARRHAAGYCWSLTADRMLNLFESLARDASVAA